MNDDTHRYRRYIGRRLAAGRLPFDYDPKQYHDGRCSVCRQNNPTGCSGHCPCHCHKPEKKP